MKNRLIIKWKITPKFPSTKVKYTQLTLPKKSIRKTIMDEAKKALHKRIEMKRNPPCPKWLHTEFIPPTFKPNTIRHNYDLYSSVESFRTKSVESAKRILSKRNIQAIASAEFFDGAGGKTVIFQN